MDFRSSALLLLSGWLLAACGLATPSPTPAATPTLDVIAQGRQVYLRTCAECHGQNGEGYANEQAAPALDASEHAWHHPDQQIRDWIENGKLGLGAEMPHIHGLGFSPDGRQLIVPAHDGLRVFADGEWSVPEVPAHDYMGYTPVDNGFYSSGHPHPSSGLINPFGLVKSTDGGETLEKLGFEGESDFHLMGAGYENHAVYVLNPASNSQLSAGLHYTLDDGQTWQPASAQGVIARPFSLAAHPTEANVVALATEDGLFLSSDYGDSFARVGDAAPVTAVAFHPDGKTLLFGAGRLLAYDFATEQITEVPSSAIDSDDAIGYIAVNPVQDSEIALATLNRDIYLSSDGGQTWSQIAEDGQAK